MSRLAPVGSKVRLRAGAEPLGILFVCAGNICRSPLAECVFRHRARERGMHHHFRADSAGTGGWQVGEPPDPRSCAVAARYGVIVEGCARQIARADLGRFDLLLCMDEENRTDVLLLGAAPDRTRLLLSYDPQSSVVEVPDPYERGMESFELVFGLIDRACRALLDALVDGSRDRRTA